MSRISPDLALALVDAGIRIWSRIAEVRLKAAAGDMSEAEAFAALEAIEIRDTDSLIAEGREEPEG